VNLPATLALAALRAVPLRRLGENHVEYGSRVYGWGATRPNIDRVAGALMRIAYDVADAMPEHEKRTLADTVNKQSRAGRNDYMRDYMKAKRAAKAEAVNAPANEAAE
jgi:hypothetical protein